MATKLHQRDLKPCDLCREGVMHNGQFVFYRIRIEQFVVDHDAVKRQLGLEKFVGHPAIAAALGPDEPLALGMGEETITVCSAHLEQLGPLLEAVEG